MSGLNAKQIADLIIQLGPLGLQLFLALEQRMNLTADEKQNIANAIASSNIVDGDTIARAAAWMQANGFRATFVPATAAPTKP